MKIEGKKQIKNVNSINIVDNWLKDHGDPAIDRLIKKNLEIGNKIAALLEAKNMRPIDLAKAMGKQRSEVSKWLSGQHTFTTKTITKIEEVLDEDIIHIKPKINNVYFTAYVNVRNEAQSQKDPVFKDSLYEDMYTAEGY
ncbi:MAG: helix-turn-helix domain-containing protein [Sphingobacterium sp.]